MSGYRNNPEVVEENYYFHAIVENMDKKQIIIRTIVKAEFVRPLLKFSQKSMYFRTDYGVEETITFVRGKLR